MIRNGPRFLFGGLALLLLVAASAASAPDASRSAEAPRLVAGEALVLATADGSGLVLTPADNPVIRFVEVEGAEVVVRLTPIDRTGVDLGSGRVIVVGASEKRDVRLREQFAREDLHGVELRVEALQGGGRLLVYTPAENGNGLYVQQTDATPPRRRRAVTPMPAPTSLALIDKAETSGALDGETALLYRVYALFSDARLPAQYRGDDSKIEDSLYMAEVRDRFATLSPATQAAVLPFLTPPAYQGSWANAAAGSSLTILATPPPCQFFSDKWASVDTTNGLVRIWYQPDLADAQRAGSVAGRIDSTLWPKIDGLMTNHRPVPDLNQDCNGGNGRLDIYLSDVPHSETIPYTECNRGPRSVFILLKRTSPDVLAVHEIFHAFQNAYPLAGCITDENYRWWAEASAQWSQDFVIPADRLEQSAAPAFLGAPEKQLDLRDKDHEYGAYLLPFYVYRKSGDAAFVRKSWENSAGQPALEALDQALSGGFDKVWPEFAKQNWNQKPVDDYKTWDGLTATATEAGGTLGALPDAENTLKLDLPRLSATYKHFYFDDTVRTIAFWNGVTFKLSLEARIQELGVQYQSDPASADEKKGAHVDALIKMRGQDWQVADWTNLPYVTFCRDVLAERIDELVLIISNSEFKTRDRKLKPPALAPLIWVSNMGCWRWKGTATYTDGEGVMISTNVTWTRPDASLAPPFVSYKPEGTENWSSSGASCNGSGTLPILPELSTLFTYNFTPAQGSFHRSYWGAGVDTREVTTTCPPPVGDFQLTLSAWLLHPVQPIQPGLPFARFLLVNANGRVMDDSFTIPKDEWKWHFEAQREP